MADQLLTPEQAAERLLVAKKTILTWLRTGQLKGRKAGSLWRIRERDLEAFLVEPELPAAAVEDEPPSAPPITYTIEPHTPENRELERRIRAMHADGLTNRQIANRLNKEGLPAGTETGRWDVTNVQAWLVTNAWYNEHRVSTADK